MLLCVKRSRLVSITDRLGRTLDYGSYVSVSPIMSESPATLRSQQQKREDKGNVTGWPVLQQDAHAVRPLWPRCLQPPESTCGKGGHPTKWKGKCNWSAKAE